MFWKKLILLNVALIVMCLKIFIYYTSYKEIKINQVNYPNIG